MKNKYIITRMHDAIFSFLLEDDKVSEIHINKNDISILGSIYIGRIQNIAKNLNAAFIEIENKNVCYLPLEQYEQFIYTKKGSSPLPQQGDELLVQVQRDAIKSKAAAVTGKLTFHGRYVLLITGNQQIGYSSKLKKQKKIELSAYVEKILQNNPCLNSFANTDGTAPFGWLLRTNCSEITLEELQAEMEQLYHSYRKLLDIAKYRCPCSCIQASAPPYLQNILGTYEGEVDEYITDDKELYEKIKTFLFEHNSKDLSKLRIYEDPLLPLAKLYALDRELKDALRERVWLKSGGFLILQPTEALTVIDVNTGQYEGGKNKSAAILKVNLEAADEIARQLRLRNISGIIIVDFINMDSEEHEKQLLARLNQLLKMDHIPTTLVDITKLSLVEITRMKKEKPLLEQIQEIKGL